MHLMLTVFEVVHMSLKEDQRHCQVSLAAAWASVGFIIGFFLAAIPWYVGVFFLLCARVDHREKPGLVACTIAASLSAIAAIIGGATS
ncbi:60S ribosomal protein [Musa troglodytarum]|uniref:60S ribosomal protein n=1 Tax=Musa troglodytarum TaxID=320322 RepID=A0A9E7L9L3_9LILI|nr:60S ribosomal protein [Musa troglodytarum]